MATVRDFLKRAVIPLGKTMYIYGGGWNEKDTGAGKECLSLGLQENWVSFANQQGSKYNHRLYDYKKDREVIHLGLDCSAYVGWVLYNTLGDRDYVFKSTEVVKSLSGLGLGIRVPREEVGLGQPGDIFSSACDCCSHVYICLGQCRDGSRLLIHSSPPGVRLSATPTPDCESPSMAEELACDYMGKYYPGWYSRFPYVRVPLTYLTHYEQLKPTFLSDREGIREMECSEVLQKIFIK